jgi:SPP1 gp7 family putative phage head morphogenesis protein
MNVSDSLANLYIVRQLILQRLIAGKNIDMNKHLDDVAAEIEKSLRSGKEFTTYQKRRLDSAISELASLITVPAPNFKDLAKLEAEFVANSIAKVAVEVSLPAAAVLNTIANTALIEGASIGQWFSKLTQSMRFDLSRAIKLGVSLGETNSQIAKRIIGAAGSKGSEVIPRGRRDAMAITRTGVQTVSNEARLATYSENEDIIKGLQWVSTLDGRTTVICAARSGKVWTLPDYRPQGHNIPWNGGPPAHWSCRSTVIPVLKTWREMGINKDELPTSTRASMDGQVASDLSFDSFLRGKPASFSDEMLGVGRAKLWRDGKITLSELLNAKGRAITLTELRNKYGG